MAFDSNSKLKIKIVLPNEEHLLRCYQATSLVVDVFHEVCTMLDVEDRDLFGLAVFSNESYLFLDPRERLSKINFRYLTLPETYSMTCSKIWRHLASASESFTIKKNSIDKTQSKMINADPVVYFRLRFYVPIHCLRDRSTLHAYYCQLRNNVLNYELFCSFDVYLNLAAFALQADIGNAPPVCVRKLEKSEKLLPVYFTVAAYYPTKLVTEVNVADLIRWTLIRHTSLHNMAPYVAEFWYIRLASKRGSNFNMHLYSLPRLRQPRFAVSLGVTPDGLLIHQQDKDKWIRPTVPIRWKEIDHVTYKSRTLLVILKNNQGIRRFPLRHTITASHLFNLISHMHFYQATAELSAPHAAGLLKQIERGTYEERHL